MTADRDTAETVADALQTSRREHLALTRVRPDPREREQDRLQQRADELTASREWLREERDALPWHRRADRRAIDDQLEHTGETLEGYLDQLDATAADLAEYPAKGAPALTPARNPLPHFDTNADLTPERDLAAPDLTDDLGPDLGP